MRLPDRQSILTGLLGICAAIAPCLGQPAPGGPAPGGPAPAAPARAGPAPAAVPTTRQGSPIDGETAPVSPSGETITRIILNLDSADFTVRQTAALRLNSLGADALPQIEAALELPGTGAEAKIRLRSAINILRPRAALQKLQRERVAWKNRQFFESYLKHGRSNPAYDQDVKTAMEGLLALGADPAKAPPERRQPVLDAFAAAAQKGCDDHLVYFMHQLTLTPLERADPKPRTFDVPLVRHVEYKLLGTKYPEVIKFWAIFRCARVADVWGSRLPDAAANLVKGIAATPGLPPNELDVNAEQLYDVLLAQQAPFGSYLGFVNAYAAARPNSPGPLVMKARYLFDRAVLERGFREPVMQQRFNEAQGLLEEAWKMDPGDPQARAATAMVTLIAVRREYSVWDQEDRKEEMELWFTRAMDANPDNYAVCKRKLGYLSLNWQRRVGGDGGDGGTEGELRAFGLWCLGTENWRGGIPFILEEVHDMLSARSSDRKEYYDRPEVWEDLRAVYEGCLVNFPYAVRQRNQYAKAATQSGKWDVAHRQFQVLGDKVMPEIFGGETTLNYLKRKAARLGQPGAKEEK